MRTTIIGGALCCSIAGGCISDGSPPIEPDPDPEGWDGVVRVRERGGETVGTLAVNGSACASMNIGSGTPVVRFSVRDGGQWIDVTDNCGQLAGNDGTEIIDGGNGDTVDVQWQLGNAILSAAVPVPPAFELLEPSGQEQVVIGRMALRWEPAGTGDPMFVKVMTTWCPDDNYSFQTFEITPDLVPELAGDAGAVVIDLRALGFRTIGGCGVELTATRRSEILAESRANDTLYARGEVIRRVNFSFR